MEWERLDKNGKVVYLATPGNHDTYRIAPDESEKDKWRADYFDLAVWVAVDPIKYINVSDAQAAAEEHYAKKLTWRKSRGY